MTKKIFRSILTVGVAVLACSLLLVMGCFYSFYEGMQEHQLGDELRIAAAAVETNGSTYLEKIKSDRFRVTWIASDGTVLYDTQADAAQMENHLEREEVREALETGTGSSSRYSATLLQKTVYSASRLTDGTVLRLSASRATMGALLLGAFQPILLVVIVLLVLSSLLASRLAKRIVEPLNALDLEHPLENDAYEELSPLLRRIDRQRRQIDAQLAELRQKTDEFTQITKFWLDLGVDGFRLDAVKEFYTGADEKNIQVLTWFNDMVKAQKEDAYLVGEAWNDSSVYAKYYQSGMDSFFDFAYADSDGIIADTIKKAGGYNASSYGKALVSTEELLGSYSDSYIDAPFYTNHDMARSAGYYSGEDSEAQTKMGNAMNLLMSGSTFLYYGEELGMKGSGKDENKRAPMYWSTDAGSEGMCDGPKDMDTVKMKYGSLEEQEVDGNSIYQYVKQILQLKNQYPEIAHGSVKFYEELSDENVCVIEKIYGEELMTIVFNISGETQQVDVREATYGTASDSREPVVCGELLTGTEPVTIDGTELTMPAYSVVLLKP